MKFFFGFLAVIAAIVVVVLLTINLFRSLDEPIVDTTASNSVYDLKSDQARDTIARHTVSGAIVADENYREVRITVSKNARTIEVLKGYNGAVEKTTTLSNSPTAYNAFLGALAAASFSNRVETSAEPQYTCVTGNRIYYQLQEASEKKVDTWSTTCDANQGNFAGSVTGTAALFRSQIPNYSEFTSGVNLLAR